MIPKISVIMSVYREPVSIVETSVLSIINQTFKNWEFIIVLDWPNNQKVKTFLEKCSKKDNRIILLVNKKNIGLTKSLNRALRVARGKYIARIDVGDLADKNRLLRQYHFLEENSHVFLVGSNVKIINNHRKVIGYRKLPSSFSKIKKILPKANVFIHSTIMFRNQGIFYRPKFTYSQDYDLYLRLLSKGKVMVNLTEDLVSYLYFPGSLSFQKKEQQNYFARKAREFYWQREKEGKDKYSSFWPAKLRKKTDTTKALRLEIFFLIQLGQIGKARRLYIRYSSQEKNILFRYFLYFILNFPLSYKLYRFLRYGQR